MGLLGTTLLALAGVVMALLLPLTMVGRMSFGPRLRQTGDQVSLTYAFGTVHDPVTGGPAYTSPGRRIVDTLLHLGIVAGLLGGAVDSRIRSLDVVVLRWLFLVAALVLCGVIVVRGLVALAFGATPVFAWVRVGPVRLWVRNEPAGSVVPVPGRVGPQMYEGLPEGEQEDGVLDELHSEAARLVGRRLPRLTGLYQAGFGVLLLAAVLDVSGAADRLEQVDAGVTAALWLLAAVLLAVAVVGGSIGDLLTGHKIGLQMLSVAAGAAVGLVPGPVEAFRTVSVWLGA